MTRKQTVEKAPYSDPDNRLLRQIIEVLPDYDKEGMGTDQLVAALAARNVHVAQSYVNTMLKELESIACAVSKQVRTGVSDLFHSEWRKHARCLVLEPMPGAEFAALVKRYA